MSEDDAQVSLPSLAVSAVLIHKPRATIYHTWPRYDATGEPMESTQISSRKDARLVSRPRHLATQDSHSNLSLSDPWRNINYGFCVRLSYVYNGNTQIELNFRELPKLASHKATLPSMSVSSLLLSDQHTINSHSSIFSATDGGPLKTTTTPRIEMLLEGWDCLGGWDAYRADVSFDNVLEASKLAG